MTNMNVVERTVVAFYDVLKKNHTSTYCRSVKKFGHDIESNLRTITFKNQMKREPRWKQKPNKPRLPHFQNRGVVFVCESSFCFPLKVTLD